MPVFERAWQLWKPLKNRWSSLCFKASEGPGGPWKVPGGSLGTLGRPPGHRGGSSGITWGLSRSRKAQSEDPLVGCDHLGGP